MLDNFMWLLNWFQDHCDGDWEHSSGIHLETLDNPGWALSEGGRACVPALRK